MKSYVIKYYCYAGPVFRIGTLTFEEEGYKVTSFIDDEVEEMLLEEDVDVEIIKLLIEGIGESMAGLDESDIEKERRYWVGSIRIELA